MKIAAHMKSFLFLALFSAAGAHAAGGSDSAGDAQQQARALLGGRNVSASVATSGTAAVSSMASATSSVDAQEQARQMILGRPLTRLPGAPAVLSAQHATQDGTTAYARMRHVKAVSDSRKTEQGGNELARRMILGSAYSENSAAAASYVRRPIAVRR